MSFDGSDWKLYQPELSVDWLVQTQDGQLWGTDGELGIIHFDGQKWTPALDLKNSPLEHAYFKKVTVSKQKKILLGTDVGLFQYDPDLNRFTDLALGKVIVHIVLEASDGTIWVCAEDQKEQKRLYNLNDGKWTAHLTSQTVTTVYESFDNDLWVGGDNGLYVFDGQSWQQKLTDKINCIYQLTDGTMLVGSDSGLWIETSIDLN